MPLKEVLKLTTGSIVELNRSIVEPVEVIVNNCVIARGEVVVVEGNFGVRIQQVVSRQERLRTLELKDACWLAVSIARGRIDRDARVVLSR